LHYSNICVAFRRLTVEVDLHQNIKEGCRPRLHDLRHRFAIETLLRWYRDGLDVQPRLPALSTYLGHADPGHTFWYLSATPELLGLAVQRLEQAWGFLG
jgi:integrase